MSNSTKSRSVFIVAVAILAVAVAVALVVDGVRINWDRSNNQFFVVARADTVAGIPLSALAHAGVGGIAVRASAVARGESPLPADIRRAGLIPVLIVDRAGEISAAISGPFPYFWVDGAIGARDPLVTRLIAAGSVLISREFSGQAVDRFLWDSGFHRFVRGHEISSADLARLGIAGTVARCVLAVRERDIRVLILAPLPSHHHSVAVFQAVTTALEREGFHSGRPAALPPTPPRAVGLVLHLGVSALFVLLFIRLFPGLPLAGMLVGGGIAGLAAGLGDIPLRTVDAFLLAIAAPVYTAAVLSPRGRLSGGIAYLLTFSGITVLFALLLAALLAHPAFIVKVYQFRGVKAAIALPPFLAVGIYLWRHKVRIRDVVIGPRSQSGLAIAARAVAVIIGMAVVWFIVMRSGNTGPVTGTEKRVRGWLEAAFFARPRFKEFLIGHPLLLLFGTKTGTATLRAGALLFGLFGQTSILNSFSHAHTPLLISLLRTANGLGLGIGIGIVVYAVMMAINRIRARLTRF